MMQEQASDVYPEPRHQDIPVTHWPCHRDSSAAALAYTRSALCQSLMNRIVVEYDSKKLLQAFVTSSSHKACRYML